MNVTTGNFGSYTETFITLNEVIFYSEMFPTKHKCFIHIAPKGSLS